MKTRSTCSHCNGSHTRCNGCGTAYPLAYTSCLASACGGATLVCRCGLVVVQSPELSDVPALAAIAASA